MYKLGSIHDSTRLQECNRMYYIRRIATLLYVGLEVFVVWQRGTVVSEVHATFTFRAV